MIKKYIIAIGILISIFCLPTITKADIKINNENIVISADDNIKVGKKTKINFFAINASGSFRLIEFPSEYYYLKYTSSDVDVATVSSSGVIQGEGEGKATITVTVSLKNGEVVGSSSTSVKVTDYPIIMSNRGTLYVKDKWRVPIYGKRKECKKWRSSNKKIATVDKNGKVKGIKKGKAIISCLIGGKRKKVKIKVVNPYMWHDVEPVDGNRIYFGIIGHSGKFKKLKSSKASVIKVKNKRLIAVKPGKAKISCVSDGVKISEVIRVYENGNTFTKKYKSIDDVTANIGINMKKVYFKGNDLKAKIEILNNSAVTLNKLVYLKIRVYYKSKKLISKSFHDYSVNVGSFRKKTYTVTLARNKKRWHRTIDLKHYIARAIYSFYQW